MLFCITTAIQDICPAAKIDGLDELGNPSHYTNEQTIPSLPPPFPAKNPNEPKKPQT